MKCLPEGITEILFKTSTGPKRLKNVKAMYTKGTYTCFSFTDSKLLLKYTTENIFSICSNHREHAGSSSKETE